MRDIFSDLYQRDAYGTGPEISSMPMDSLSDWDYVEEIHWQKRNSIALFVMDRIYRTHERGAEKNPLARY